MSGPFEDPAAPHRAASVPALDRPLRVTFFANHGAATKREQVSSLRDLVPLLRETRAPAKAALPWVKLATFGNLRTDRGSLRHNPNVAEIHGVEGDYDSEQLTMEHARKVLLGAQVAAVLYTSPSHTEATPRWRVLCPTSKALPPERRTALLARVNGLLVGALAGESFTLSQAYYFGAVAGSTAHDVVTVEGRPIDLCDELDDGAIGRAAGKPEEPPRPPVTYQRPRDSHDGTPYGLAGIENLCDTIRTAPHGQKHPLLNKSAYSAGGLVTAGQVVEGYAFSALTHALHDMHARQPCGDFKAAERTLEQAFRAGMSAPRAVPPPREIRHVIRIEMPEPEMIPWDAAPGYLTAEPDDQPHVAEAFDPVTGEITGQHLKAPAKSRLKTMSIAEVLALPPPEWLLEGVLTCGGYAGIYGPPGSLKSFTVLGMGLAIAYGEEWAGRKVKQMGVLYVAGEGARGLGKRIKAWQQHFNLAGVDCPFRLLCDGVNLTSPEDTAELIKATLEAAEAEGQPFGLVIIDTVARSMVGADENSATDMGKFNEAAAEIIRGVPGAPNVLAVHHTGKDTERGARGSNSFLGAVDTMLRITREEDRLTLKVEKQKDDEDGFDIPLKVVGVKHPDAGPDDKPYSLVILDASADPAPLKNRKAANISPAAQLGLSALVAAIETSGCERKGLPGVPGNVLSVTEAEWRRAYYSRSTAPTQEAKAVGFKRAHEALAAKGVALKVDGFAWIVRG